MTAAPCRACGHSEGRHVSGSGVDCDCCMNGTYEGFFDEFAQAQADQQRSMEIAAASSEAKTKAAFYAHIESLYLEAARARMNTRSIEGAASYVNSFRCPPAQERT